MVNQSDVARVLSRATIEDMHELLYNYTNSLSIDGYKSAHQRKITKLLAVHGWTLKEYIAQCNLGYVSDDHIKVFFLNRMITRILESCGTGK